MTVGHTVPLRSPIASNEPVNFHVLQPHATPIRYREPTSDYFFSVRKTLDKRGASIVYRVTYGCQPANTLSNLSTQLI